MSAFEIWASPEPTVARIDDDTVRDQLAETGHEARDGDIDLLAGLGVTATRYPVLWEKCEPERGAPLDLAWPMRRLSRLRELGVEPIVTLLHHGSGPRWTHLLDPGFPEAFASYAERVAREFPWVRRWTPINEPLTTARFSTLYGLWYPRAADDRSFGTAIVNEALAMLLAMERITATIPDARFVITEDLQSFRALEPSVADYVEHKRERMYLSIELVMGRVVAGHPLFDYLSERCGVGSERLDEIARRARAPDLVGWNYYPPSERVLYRDVHGVLHNDAAVEHGPIAAAPLLRAAYERLRLPFGLSEVHRNGDETARVAWLRERARDLTSLRSEGLPVSMLGAWGAFGLVDWTSLLVERRGEREDGIFTCVPAGRTPQETAVTRAVREMAKGRQ